MMPNRKLTKRLIPFVKNFIKPSKANRSTEFTYPLPDIEGLEKAGDIIIQSELKETFSTNIITQYVSKTSGINLIEIYKNTENKKTGVFIRIPGSIAIAKNGYPKVILDPTVLNVDPKTGLQRDINTFMAVSLPQASEQQSSLFYRSLKTKAEEDNIPYTYIPVYQGTPDFWGPIFWASWPGLDLDMMHTVRDHIWSAYQEMLEQTGPITNLDYTQLRDFMIYEMARREHETFAFFGLSVPEEAQAAFFTVVTTPPPGWIYFP